jgi:hypothetical protein
MINANSLALLLLALGLAASFTLWLQLKMELRQKEKHWARDLEQLRFQVGEQRSSWIQLTRKIDAPSLETVPVSAPKMESPAKAEAAAREAVLKRYKDSSPASSPAVAQGPTIQNVAVEMAKRGDSPVKIASALSIPKAHVEFLIKLQRASLQPQG